MNLNNKLEEINYFLLENGCTQYSDASDEISINILYNIYILNVIPNDIPDNLFRYIAYYYDIKQNHSMTISYLLKAISVGDDFAWYTLGRQYERKRMFPEMLTCYEIGANKGLSSAMNSLGLYHQDTTKNYEEMAKNYLKAISHNNLHAMCNYGLFFFRQKDFNNMKIYFNMAIQKDKTNKFATNKINLYLKENDDDDYASLHWNLLNEENNKKYDHIQPVCEL